MKLTPHLAAFTASLALVNWGSAALAGPPLAVTTGNLSTNDVNQCLGYMAEVLRRVGLRDVTGQGYLVGGETSRVTVIIACLQGDTTSTRWMVAVTGQDRLESERVRDNVVKSILRQ